MIDITIKNKCYHSITTIIDGRTVKIPSKGKILRLNVTKITDHMNELVNSNMINVVKNKK